MHVMAEMKGTMFPLELRYSNGQKSLLGEAELSFKSCALKSKLIPSFSIIFAVESYHQIYDSSPSQVVGYVT